MGGVRRDYLRIHVSILVTSPPQSLLWPLHNGLSSSIGRVPGYITYLLVPVSTILCLVSSESVNNTILGPTCLLERGHVSALCGRIRKLPQLS